MKMSNCNEKFVSLTKNKYNKAQILDFTYMLQITLLIRTDTRKTYHDFRTPLKIDL